MEKIYELSLILLLLLMGGGEASAKKIVYKYDFVNKIIQTKVEGESSWTDVEQITNGQQNLSSFKEFTFDTSGDTNWRIRDDGLYTQTSGERSMTIKLYQGDIIYIKYKDSGQDGDRVDNVWLGKKTAKNEVLKSVAYEDNISDYSYRVPATVDLEIWVNRYMYIEEFTIVYDEEKRKEAEYEVENGTFRFTKSGVLTNRVIKDVPHMIMTFGNTEKNNATVISDYGNNVLGATIYDENNWGHLWHEDNGKGCKECETFPYHQGTFYVFKPTIDGTLSIDGFCNVSPNLCELYDNTTKKSVIRASCTFPITRDLSAGHTYIFYACPRKEGVSTGDYTWDIFHLTSFTFKPAIEFAKQWDVVSSKTGTYTLSLSDEAKATTFYMRVEGNDKLKESVKRDGSVITWENGSAGAIIVTAVHDSGDNTATAYCVITIPYDENKEWDFSTTETKEELNLNTTVIDDKGNVVVSNTDEWALDWKVYRHEVKDDDDPTENNKGNADYYTELERPVFSNSVDVTGDNARFIDKTAGLLFFSPIKCFGTNITEIAPYYEVTERDDEGKEKTRRWGYDEPREWMSVAEISEFIKDTYKKYDLSDDYVKNDMTGESITMEVGSKMVIPNLKEGQHIRIRWDRHFWNNGELMMAENVTDLEGTSMNKKLFYVGAGSVNVVYGHHEFIVETDGDVVFTLVDNGDITIKDKDGNDKTITVSGQQGWVNIKNIKIGPLPEKDPNFYFDTHMTPTLVADTENAINNPKKFEDTNVKEKETDYKRDAIYTYLHRKEKITTNLSLSKNDLHTQNGRQNDKYHILGDNDKEKAKGIQSRTGTLTKANCDVPLEKGDILNITEGAHGSFTLVLESRHSTIGDEKDAKTPFYCYEDFLLDSCHVKVSVYEYDYNVKPYPYTWAMEHITKDTGNNTEYELENESPAPIWDKDEKGNNKTTTYWTKYKENDNELYKYRFNVGYPENVIGWKERFGGTEKFVPEFDGLGFIPEEYWDNHDKNVVLQPIHEGLILSGGKSYQLIVPEVKNGQTVYLAVTGDSNESSVTLKEGDTKTPLSREAYNGSVYVDEYEKSDSEKRYKDNNYENGYYYRDDTNNPLHIYKIAGKGGDVNLLLKDLTVHKVAVSVDTKKVTEAGYATEAREYPLDFTLANLFLGREQKAYKVTGVTNTDKDRPNVTISEVRYIPRTIDKTDENNGVMITGYDLTTGEKVSGGNEWPLFTTDIDRATSDMSGNKLVGVVDNKQINNVSQRTEITTDGEKDYLYNYMLSLAGYVVEYEDNDEVDDDGYHNSTGTAGEEVKGLGFYLVMVEGTKMPNGSTYEGGKPQDHSAYLQLEKRLAKQNDLESSYDKVTYGKLRQVFFVDVDSILTDIDEVLIDDKEHPTKGDNSSANFMSDGVFYTLQGVAVKSPKKGIYIFNGKKVYVK